MKELVRRGDGVPANGQPGVQKRMGGGCQGEEEGREEEGAEAKNLGREAKRKRK